MRVVETAAAVNSDLSQIVSMCQRISPGRACVHTLAPSVKLIFTFNGFFDANRWHDRLVGAEHRRHSTCRRWSHCCKQQFGKSIPRRNGTAASTIRPLDRIGSYEMFVSTVPKGTVTVIALIIGRKSSGKPISHRHFLVAA